MGRFFTKPLQFFYLLRVKLVQVRYIPYQVLPVKQVNGGLGNTVGDGLLCTGGQSARSQVQVTSAGSTSFTDFQGLPFGASSYGAGVETNYQLWYRDPANTCSGTGFNFSNGWTVTWLP